MVTDPAFLRRWTASLPRIRAWMNSAMAGHETQSVLSLKLPLVGTMFTEALLARTQVAFLDGPLPTPPFRALGLPEFEDWESQQSLGITYGSTYFLRRETETESLHVHELVHVVQWETLGFEGFLLAYGAGLLRCGYRDSPLEKMAFDLQAEFDDGILAVDLIDHIAGETKRIAREEGVWLS